MDTVLLVAHLCGVALLFIMISMELVALCGAPRATTVQQLRASLYAGKATEVLAPVATVLIVVTGLWMVASLSFVDFSQGWVIVAIVVTAVLAVMGPTVQGKRMTELGEAAANAPDGPVTPELAAMARDRVMQSAGWGSTGAAFAFLYLMTARPDALWAIVSVVIGSALGVAVGQFLLGAAHTSTEVAPGLATAD